MGLVARMFGNAPRSQQPKMSPLQSSTREQTQRQLLTMALRDTLKKNGVITGSLTAEGVPGIVVGRGRGMHVQLVFRDWEPTLLPYVVALEHAFRCVEDRRELTQRDRSNLTHPQGYLMAASPVDIS